MSIVADERPGSALSVSVAAKVMGFAARGASRIERDVLRGHGLSAEQWRILCLLSEAGDPLHEGVAADDLLHDEAFRDGLLRLQGRGIVVHDAHSDAVTLTSQGASLFHAVQPRVAECGAREFATLSSSELEELHSRLTACESRAQFRLDHGQI